MPPKVTVIIPVYNAGKTIRRCIQSIQRQTFQDWIAYVIDDGSTDSSLKICEEIAAEDQRIQVFHKTNGGVSSARNYAIERVATPFFVCVDSDDFVESEYLQGLLDTQEKYPTIGSVWTGFQTVDDNKAERIETHILSFEEKYSFFKKNQVVTLYQLWMLQIPVAKLYCTQVVRDCRLRMDEQMTVGEDAVFNLDYLSAVNDENIVVLNAPLYNYVRSNPDSLDHKFQPNLSSDSRKMMQKLWEKATAWEVGEQEMQKLRNTCFYSYERILRNTYHPNNPQTRKEKLKYNNSILQSTEFKRLLNEINCYIHPLYRMAYRSGNYRNVLRFEKIVTIKNICKGRLKAMISSIRITLAGGVEIIDRQSAIYTLLPLGGRG